MMRIEETGYLPEAITEPTLSIPSRSGSRSPTMEREDRLEETASAELVLPQSVAATLCRERVRWHSCPKNDNFHMPTGTRVGRCISIYECGHLGTMLDEGYLILNPKLHPSPLTLTPKVTSPL